MDKKLRDRKRKQSAIERVRAATQGFEREMNRCEQMRWYEPDLDDLEVLARYFEGCVKAMKHLNDKALKQKQMNWRVSEDGETWVTTGTAETTDHYSE